jgi:hypothetical protein
MGSHRGSERMIQDYRPDCFWCNKKLNKKERTHHKRENDFLCEKCFYKWKIITIGKIITNKQEEY